MELRSGVYELAKIHDDPRYEGFASDEFLVGGIPQGRAKSWQKLRLATKWKRPKVVGRVRKFNDFPCVGLMPAFSERAVDALRDFLEPNGELLPLTTQLGSYYAYNLTTIVDALDLQRSRIRWLRKPITAIEIERFEFIEKKLVGRSIFHLPQEPTIAYVAQSFVFRAQANGLRGMNFKKVWPLSPGADWRKEAKKQSEIQKSEGLPLERRLKGNAVVIRLFLRSSVSRGIAAERSAIEKLMNEIDSQLVEVDRTESAVGNLEGFDFGVPGECRLFLSCPDADVLVRRLSPWLRKLKWPAGFEVFARYGNFAEHAAPQQLVKL
jgi:hypothetical protein